MSRPPARETLEDFALKSMNFAKMTGVAVAAHAVSDSFLLMHSGVGCKYKTAAQGAEHDLAEHPNVREAWTQISESHLIAGCSERIGPFARAWWERRNSAVMIVVSAYFIELTGDDIGAAVGRVEDTLPDCDMVYVNTVAPNTGFFDGYASVVVALMRRMDWSRPPSRRGHATVLGGMFTRYEPDAKADVAQLKSLLKVAGWEAGPILFSGQPYAELKQAPESGLTVMLPYMRPRESEARELLGSRATVDVDLPIGFAGTANFVRALARNSGTDTRKVEAWITQQTDAVRAQLQRVSEQLRHQSFAVFAETPLAAGLVALLHELGVRTPLVGLRDTSASLGGREAFDAALVRLGVNPQGITVLAEPSMRTVRDRCLAALDRGEITGVIGSSHELDLFQRAGSGNGPMRDLALLETGYPSNRTHAVLMQPTYGFAGAAAWAQRILDVSFGPRQSSGLRFG